MFEEEYIDVSGIKSEYDTVETNTIEETVKELKNLDNYIYNKLRCTVGYIRTIENSNKNILVECGIKVGKFINNHYNIKLLSEGLLVLNEDKIEDAEKKYYLVDCKGKITGKITDQEIGKSKYKTTFDYNVNNIFYLSFSGRLDWTPFIEYKNIDIKQIFGAKLSGEFGKLFMECIKTAKEIKPIEGNMEWFATKRHGLPKELLTYSEEQVVYGEYIINPQKYKGIINEGLIKTYPTLKTIDYVKREMSKNPNVNMDVLDIRIFCPRKDSQIYNKILVYYPQTSLDNEIYNHLKKCFDLCGYYLAGQWTNQDNKVIKIGYVCMQFEPKIGDEEKNDQLQRYLYHLTDLKHYQKIILYGFCPRTNNKMFEGTPERVYFFTELDVDLFDRLIRDKGWNLNAEYKILIVDRELIPNVRFFNDPRYVESGAIYTKENVPNRTIIDVKTMYHPK